MCQDSCFYKKRGHDSSNTYNVLLFHIGVNAVQRGITISRRFHLFKSWRTNAPSFVICIRTNARVYDSQGVFTAMGMWLPTCKNINAYLYCMYIVLRRVFIAVGQQSFNV